MRPNFWFIDTSPKILTSLLNIEAEVKCLIMKTGNILTTYFKNDSQKTLAVKTIERYFLGFGHGRFTSGIWSITH